MHGETRSSRADSGACTFYLGPSLRANMAGRTGAYRAAREEKSRRGGSAKGPGEAAAVDLDRVIHERMRLGIVSALAVNASLTFNELKELVRASDGNLSVHARKLEDAGYVHCTKSFAGRVPRTDYRLA